MKILRGPTAKLFWRTTFARECEKFIRLSSNNITIIINKQCLKKKMKKKNDIAKDQKRN